MGIAPPQKVSVGRAGKLPQLPPSRTSSTTTTPPRKIWPENSTNYPPLEFTEPHRLPPPRNLKSGRKTPPLPPPRIPEIQFLDPPLV